MQKVSRGEETLGATAEVSTDAAKTTAAFGNSNWADEFVAEANNPISTSADQDWTSEFVGGAPADLADDWSREFSGSRLTLRLGCLISLRVLIIHFPQEELVQRYFVQMLHRKMTFGPNCSETGIKPPRKTPRLSVGLKRRPLTRPVR